MNASTTARVGGSLFHVVESPAAAAVERLEDEELFANKVRFAVITLKDDPGCIEAHLFLAEHARDEQTAYSHLAKAVEAGRQLWVPLAAGQCDSAYWGVVATRPFMRTLGALGDLHADQEDTELPSRSTTNCSRCLPWTAKESATVLPSWKEWLHRECRRRMQPKTAD